MSEFIRLYCPKCNGYLNMDGDCQCGYEECRDIDKRAKAHGVELTPEETRQIKWRLGHGEATDLIKQVEYLSHEVWLLKERTRGIK